MEIRKVVHRDVPLPAVLILLVVLPILGFLIGNIGNFGGGGSTTSVDTTVTPAHIGLEPGESDSVTVVVGNPNDYGVRVASIGASRSEAVEGCPEGVLTSAEVTNPIGYIGPSESEEDPARNGFQVPVTLAENAPEGCLQQELVLPLTVELASARG